MGLRHCTRSIGSKPFLRFLGLWLEDRVPEAKTVWLYRDGNAQAGMSRS